MTRQEALEFIKRSPATHFRYGDLSYATAKDDAIADIMNMDDDMWYNGDVHEEYISFDEYFSSYDDKE